MKILDHVMPSMYGMLVNEFSEYIPPRACHMLCTIFEYILVWCAMKKYVTLLIKHV